MIKTYQGYFKEGGLFVADGSLIQIPARRRAIVNILEDEVVGDVLSEVAADISSNSRKQKEALDRFYIGLGKIDDEPLDDEFDAVMNQRFNIVRELDV